MSAHRWGERLTTEEAVACIETLLKRYDTQKEIATALGVTEVTISRWKNGNGFAPLKLRELAQST